MSKILQFKDKGSTDDKKIDKSTAIWVSLILTACIIAVIGGIFSNKGKSQSEEATTSAYDVGYVEGQDYSDSDITTYAYEHNVLHGTDIEQAMDNINIVLDYVKSGNAYTRIQVGEYDYDYYIYNNSGECLAQTSDGVTCVIFRKDGYNSIAFGGDTGNILEGNDIDILKLIDGVVSVASSDTNNRDGITVFDMVVSPDSDVADTTHEYRVEVVGEDNFKEIYSSISEELGNNIVDNLKEQVSSVSENEYVPHVIYTFLLDTDEKALTISCDLIVDGEEHTNWLLDGYIMLDNWQLSEDWYTDDFSTLTTDESFDKLNEVLGTLDGLITKYFDDNNVQSEENVSSVEESENSEENEGESEENSNLGTDNESSSKSPDNNLDVENNSSTSEE